jgi:hypothetical protein
MFLCNPAQRVPWKNDGADRVMNRRVVSRFVFKKGLRLGVMAVIAYGIIYRFPC